MGLMPIDSASAQQNTFQLEFYLSAGDDARDAIQNTQGNYVVVGSTLVGGANYDPVISIVSPTGVLLQSKSFASTTSDFFYSICRLVEGCSYKRLSLYTCVF